MKRHFLLVLISFLFLATSCTDESPWAVTEDLQRDHYTSNQIDIIIIDIIVTVNNPDQTAHRNAYIDLEHNGNGIAHQATTNTQGKAAFKNIKKGRYTITVVKEDGSVEEFDKVITQKGIIDIQLEK